MKPKQGKVLTERVLSYIIMINYLYVSLSEILEECGVTAEQSDNAIKCVEKRSLYYINRKHGKSTSDHYNTYYFEAFEV